MAEHGDVVIVAEQLVSDLDTVVSADRDRAASARADNSDGQQGVRSCMCRQ